MNEVDKLLYDKTIEGLKFKMTKLSVALQSIAAHSPSWTDREIAKEALESVYRMPLEYVIKEIQNERTTRADQTGQSLQNS